MDRRAPALDALGWGRAALWVSRVTAGGKRGGACRVSSRVADAVRRRFNRVRKHEAHRPAGRAGPGQAVSAIRFLIRLSENQVKPTTRGSAIAMPTVASTGRPAFSSPFRA